MSDPNFCENGNRHRRHDVFDQLKNKMKKSSFVTWSAFLNKLHFKNTLNDGLVGRETGYVQEDEVKIQPVVAFALKLINLYLYRITGLALGL